VKPRISESELEVMRVLWRAGQPLSYSEIRTELERTTEWSKSTIQTLVGRLRDKGFVTARRRHVTLYTPNVSEQEYAAAEGKSLLNKVFDGSAKRLVAALYQSGDLTDSDIDDLRQFFTVGGDES